MAMFQNIKRLMPAEAGEYISDVAQGTLVFHKPGESWGRSLLKSAAISTAGALVPPFGFAMDLMYGGVGAAIGVGELGYHLYWNNVAKNYNPYKIGGGYQDTQRALTMRQQAVQQMQQSRINGNLILGNEASFLHK